MFSKQRKNSNKITERVMGGQLMALKELMIDGEIDRIQIAIDRIKSFAQMAETNNRNGYYVAVSGGKDSSVIQELCIMSGVNCEFVHNHTTVDYPETVYFVREEKQRIEKLGYRYTIDYPIDNDGKSTSIWKLIGDIYGLPTRTIRWCCEYFKEHGGEDRFVITGVRWAESNGRKSRGTYETFVAKGKKRITLNNDNDEIRTLVERCISQGKFILNPIIDWSDSDVWEFIKTYKIPYNPLYDKGYKRVGCVGCPNSRNDIELERNPKYKQMYIKAATRYLKYRESKGKINVGNWETPEKYYLWWTEQVKKEECFEDQMSLEELEL